MAVFQGRTVVVTGGTSGIGKAIALGLLGRGAKVVVLGRNAERLRAVAIEAGGPSERWGDYRVDLTVSKDLTSVSRRLRADLPEVDILVHSAGDISFGKTEEATVRDLDRLYRISVRAPFMLTQALLPLLKARQGQIVFVNSSLALTARGGMGPYVAMKHALKGLADSVRAEVNGEGVRVLTAYVGRTATPMQERAYRYEQQAYRPELLLQPDDVASAVMDALALARTAEVTDVHIRPMRKAR